MESEFNEEFNKSDSESDQSRAANDSSHSKVIDLNQVAYQCFSIWNGQVSGKMRLTPCFEIKSNF